MLMVSYAKFLIKYIRFLVGCFRQEKKKQMEIVCKEMGIYVNMYVYLYLYEWVRGEDGT